MASQHVEVEAAKLLHKLIQESKDEPAKLAMKLHVICQHMRSSGKEQSLPYQVISRAMETVVNQHGLDVELLRSSRSPLPGGQQVNDSRHVRLKDNETPDTQVPTSSVGVTHPALPCSNWQAASSSQTKEAPFAGSFQNYGMINDSNMTPNTIHMARQDMLAANRPVMPSRSGSIGADVHQGPTSQRSSKSLDYESPSSYPMEDIRSANSQEGIDAVKTDNQTYKKDTRKAGSKRKKTDFPSDGMQTDTLGTGLTSRNPKHASKGLQAEIAMKRSDHVQVNPARNATDSDHLISVSDRAKQEDDQLPFEKITNKTMMSNSLLATPITRPSEEGEVSSSGNVFGLQKGGLPPSRNSTADHSSIWNQNRVTVPSENSQGSSAGCVEPYSMIKKEVMYPSNDPNNNMHEVTGDGSVAQSDGTGKVNAQTSGAMNSFRMQKIGFPGSYSNPSFENHNLFEKGKDVNMSETSTAFIPSDKAMMQARVISRMKGNAYNTPQRGGSQQWQTNDNALVKEEANLCDEPAKTMDMITSRSTTLATGSGVMTQASGSSSTPFREQDLKQLRAQCIVFLAFRNGLMPWKLHLEVALGNGFPKEGWYSLLSIAYACPGISFKFEEEYVTSIQ